jgi:hypothetical protein
MESMVRRKVPSYGSSDPLDLGEALSVAAWHPAEGWARVLTDRSLRALETLWQAGAFEESDRYRLAFREFGTTIGVQARRANAAVAAVVNEFVRALLGLC